MLVTVIVIVLFVFQAEDGIRDLVRSRGLGDVYKRQGHSNICTGTHQRALRHRPGRCDRDRSERFQNIGICLLYTSDAADERSSVDLGGRRIIKKKNDRQSCEWRTHNYNNHNRMK